MKRSILLAGAALCGLMATAQTSPKGPTMGWSSWNTYYVNINENIIKKQADAMASKGFKTVGYKYINIDDGFFGGRDKSTGKLIIHPTRFPNGLKPVADYIHSKGLKAGIYSDAGANTCGNYHNGDVLSVDVGMYRYDDTDADFYFNECGFDFIKVDFCGGDPIHNSDRLKLDERERYTAIHNAIEKIGRDDIRFNVCRWAYPGTWVHDVSTSWRISQDINASWGSVKDIIGQNLYLSAYCYDGCYNDMDMLEVGKGMTSIEDRTHFGMWCIMDSPLLIGCDMTNIATQTLSLLLNRELIAINQDPLYLQAYVADRQGDTYVLVKDIEEKYGKVRAVALYNPTDEAKTMTLDFKKIDLGGKVSLRDLFGKSEKGTYEGSFSVNVPAHGTHIYKATAEERLERTIYEAETGMIGTYQEISNNTDPNSPSGTYSEADNCSGGVKVGWLGMKSENDLKWRNVYSKNGGEYTLDLAFICGESRNMVLEINGKKINSSSYNSGGWGTIAHRQHKVTLLPGENTVRLYASSSNWMPDIDCMTLTPNVPVAIEKVQQGTDNDASAYSLNGTKVDPKAKGIVIRGKNKILNR